MTNGVLIVVGKKKILQVKFINAKGKEVEMLIADSELSLELTELKRTTANKLEGLAVELEETKGQPSQVREQGKVWCPSRSVPTASTTTQQTQQKDAPRKIWEPRKKGTDTKSEAPPNSTSLPSGFFHNPYNFVPAPPRKMDDSNLGDIGNLPLAGHGCYLLDRWSGRISVKLKTITPLLIPDVARAKPHPNNKEHKIYPIRVDLEGKPYLPPTSIKGMLRSAYEAVTNSRFSVFEKHDDRLVYRMPARPVPIPTRVELRGENLFLRIMKEPKLIGYAGKLRRYRVANTLPLDKDEDKVATRFEVSKDLPQNGMPVWVSLKKGIVERIQPWNFARPDNDDWRKGWVYITGANIKNKIYERVFLEMKDSKPIPVPEEIKTLWKELILNYQETHKKDLEKRKKSGHKPQAYLGTEPGKTGWSYHIYTSEAAELKEGTLCYAEFKGDQIEALIPVSISRRLYKIPPHQLLDESLQPAKDLTELSPADRVFGWVNQKGKGAYKGHLRVSKVQCHPDSTDPNKGIESFKKGLPLAILGQPKPEQARFYVAKNKQGEPLDNGSAKGKAYQSGNGLRGRKVYPHHRGLPLEEHWKNPTNDRTQTNMLGHFQEYRRPTWIKEGVDKTRDDQNRSIEDWVKRNVEFTFNIDISNFLDVELGALLWLLSLPNNHYHRLGGGKPLGFGSVQLTIDWKQTDLRKGEDWKKFYGSLDDVSQHIDDAAIKKTIEAFKKSAVEAYGEGINDFQQIPFIQAFCRCAEGFEDGKPIHYPRISQHPNPEGKAFEWFTMNEKDAQQKGGLKLSLPSLIDDHGIPLLPISPT